MSKYSQSFKEEAVQLALSSKHPTSYTARELGIKANTLYNWISTHRLNNNTAEDMENIKLRKELKRVQQELEILKKASAYFAKHIK